MSETANMISRETHEALLEKAVRDANAEVQQTLTAKTEEVAALNAQVDTLGKQNADLNSQVERLNKDLDTAQVTLKTATDEVAALRADAAAKQVAAEKAELASKRADQVKTLGLFNPEYIAEKASKWADFADADWNDRVEEWRNLKPAGAPVAETASAMSGTSGTLADKPVDEAKQISPRRAVLGLPR